MLVAGVVQGKDVKLVGFAIKMMLHEIKNSPWISFQRLFCLGRTYYSRINFRNPSFLIES